ncbi:MAG: GYF domain-containing protein [Xanthobacteraceae bacterium]
MADRVWFYADGGKQLGPFSEDQFRDLIAAGTIMAATYVWAEGMAGWQRAGEVPGLMTGGTRPPRPPSLDRGNIAGADFGGGTAVSAASGASGRSLWIDFGIWDFTWRSIVLALCSLIVIPLPWVLVWYLKWLVPRVQVPGRPNLGFEGTAMTVVLWFFGSIVVMIALAISGSALLGNLSIVVQLVLQWLFVKWLIANLSAGGRPLGLGFSGSVWAFIGWAVLGAVSVITIIGWAWVYTAWMRWFCGNIQGTRRAVVFNGSGLGFLWRAIVAAIAAAFIIPIPWVYRWMMRWLAAQTELVDPEARA